MYNIYLNPTPVISMYNTLIRELNPPTVPLFTLDELWDVFECAQDVLNGCEIEPTHYDFYRKYILSTFPTDIAFSKWFVLVGEANIVFTQQVASVYRLTSPLRVEHQHGVYRLFWRAQMFNDVKGLALEY